MPRPLDTNRLRPSNTLLIGFSGEISRPLGVIDLKVVVGERTRSRRMTMDFAILHAASLYNVLLGKPGISILKVVPSTIHDMFKFPIPGGVVTIITQPSMIVECRRAKKMCMPDVTSKMNEGALACCNIVEQTTEEVKVNVVPGNLLQSMLDFHPNGSMS